MLRQYCSRLKVRICSNATIMPCTSKSRWWYGIFRIVEKMNIPRIACYQVGLPHTLPSDKYPFHSVVMDGAALNFAQNHQFLTLFAGLWSFTAPSLKRAFTYSCMIYFELRLY